MDKGIFCCFGFRHLVDNAGERGLSVIVVARSDGLGFSLQSRGVSAVDISAIGVAPVDLNVASEYGIQFCPFCGFELDLLARRNLEEVRSLEEKHRRLMVQ
jgi:hypothetical protein